MSALTVSDLIASIGPAHLALVSTSWPWLTSVGLLALCVVGLAFIWAAGRTAKPKPDSQTDTSSPG